MNARSDRRRLTTLLFPVLLLLWGCGDGVLTPTAVGPQLARGGNGGGGGGGGADPVVESVVPDDAFQGQTLDIVVGGQGFESEDDVVIGIDGEAVAEVTTNSTTFLTSESLAASITVDAAAEVGSYDVIVQGRRGRKGIGTALLHVHLATDLGSLGDDSWAMDVNDSGEIVGWASASTGRRAVYWDPLLHELVDLGPGWPQAVNKLGQVTGHELTPAGEWRGFVIDARTGVRSYLQPLPGHDRIKPKDINDSGHVVGESGPGETPTGFVWDGVTMKALQGLPGGSGTSRPFGMNNSGHVVGVSGNGSGSTQAAIWLDTDEAPIELTAGADYAYAYGVSDPVDGSVYVAGQRGHSNHYWATVWTVDVLDGSFEYVDLASHGYAFDVNSSGEVVGDARIDARVVAYLWRVSGVVVVEALELGALDERTGSRALGVNEDGMIVGWSGTPKVRGKSSTHAVLWQRLP